MRVRVRVRRACECVRACARVRVCLVDLVLCVRARDGKVKLATTKKQPMRFECNSGIWPGTEGWK